jgi:sugar lactone lactonase YvrE
MLPPSCDRQLWVSAGIHLSAGSNTAIFSVVENEHRGYFYAPGTNTAIMTGGTWRPLLQSRDGVQIGVLETPERPGSLVFGGEDHQTLFIGARSSLYAIRTAVPGATQ